MKRHRGDSYMLEARAPVRAGELGPVAALCDRAWGRHRCGPHLAAALAEGAGARDALLALLHAAHLRRLVAARLEARDGQREGGGDGGGGGGGGGCCDGELGAELQRERRRRLGWRLPLVGRSRRGGGGSDGSASSEDADGAAAAARARRLERRYEAAAAALRAAPLPHDEMEALVSEAGRAAKREVSRFAAAAAAAGWRTDAVLLSPEERSGYCLQ